MQLSHKPIPKQLKILFAVCIFLIILFILTSINRPTHQAAAYNAPVEYFVFATVPNTLRVQQRNAIRSWIVIDPAPRQIILFCNEPKVKDEIFALEGLRDRLDLVQVLPVPKETEPRNNRTYPFLDSLFLSALEYVKLQFNKKPTHQQNDYFLVYTNGDIVFTQSFGRTMLGLEKIRKEQAMQAGGGKDVFGIARRFNLELGDFEIPFTLDQERRQEVDALLQQKRKAAGELIAPFAEDLFVYTPRSFEYEFKAQQYTNEVAYLRDENIAIPSFVVAAVAWDNWLTGYAVLRPTRILGIDISASAIIIHHNHGDWKGSHTHPWTKYNSDIYYPHGIGYYGYIDRIPIYMAKDGELRNRAGENDPPLADYVDR